MGNLYLQMFFLDTAGFTNLMKQEYQNQGRVLRELGFVK